MSWRRNKNKNATLPGLDTFIRTYRSEQAANRKQEAGEDSRNRTIEKWTLGFVILTTIGIFGQAYILNNSDEAIHKSAEAAKVAADAAKASVETTKAVMQLDQRAWLGIESIRSEPLIPEIGKTFVVYITIKNTGKTPARKIVSRGRGEPILKGGKPNFSYNNIAPFAAHLMPGNDAATTVAPMTVPGTNTSVVVNKDIFDGLNDGIFSPYVHGRIEYEDIFGQSHWVTYCSNLLVPFNGKFGFCPDHNDTDDYQPREN